tara:strand:+ start:46 stop:498 length:453 start_codon:yes stop_codon:yes gene_type:complete
MDKKIVKLDAFRRRAGLEENKDKDMRVWGRVQRTQDILTSGGFASTDAWRDAWQNAASALIQYADNEWPIEKQNKCRADQIAEYAATLFVTGSFDRELNSRALDVQTAVLEGFESSPLLAASRQKYGIMVENLMQTYFSAPSLRVSTPEN